MAKAVLATSRSDGTWYVQQVYPDGTDMTKVANPLTGQLLLKWLQGNEPSQFDNLTPDIVCNGLATIIATTNINWTPVKAAIN